MSRPLKTGVFLRKCKKNLNGAFGADFDVYGQQKLVSKSKTPGNTRSVADYVPQLGTDVVLIGVLYTSANVLRKCTMDSACLKAKNDIVTAGTNLGVSFFRSPAPGEQHIHLPSAVTRMAANWT